MLAHLLDFEAQDARNLHWYGESEDGGTVLISINDGVLGGKISRGGSHYRLLPTKDELLLVSLDTEGFPPCRGIAPAHGQSYQEVCNDGSSLAPAETPARVDVMVLFTARARDLADSSGNEAIIRQRIQEAVEEANVIFSSRGSMIEFQLVHVDLARTISDGSLLAYEEFGSASTDLSWVATEPLVELSRNTSGADLVALVVAEAEMPGEQDLCGRAQGMLGYNFGPAFAEFAFQVTELACLENLTLVHEFGHNLGLHHQRGAQGAPEPNEATLCFSFGHVDSNIFGFGFRTIMGTPDDCSFCERIPYFSNPDQNAPDGGNPTGIENEEDNDRALALMAPIGSRFRCRPTLFSDVAEDHWAAPYIAYAHRYCVVEGFPDGTYRPEQNVSRAEVLKMAYEGSRRVPNASAIDPNFPDVDPENPLHWFYRYVADAVEKGFISGRNCQGGLTGFCPDEEVSRYETAKIMHAVFEGIDYSDPENSGACLEGSSTNFLDVDGNDWYCQAADWMATRYASWNGERVDSIASGYSVSGYGSYLGGNDVGQDGRLVTVRSVNRAEMAKIVSNAMNFKETGGSTLPNLSGGSLAEELHSYNHGPIVETLGRLYEQVSASENPFGPQPPTASGGNQQTVSGPVPIVGEETDGDGENLFYSWNSTGGTFSTSDPTDFSSVTWIPPNVSVGTTYVVSVTNGDRSGRASQARFEFLVPGSAAGSVPSGSITSPTGTHTGSVFLEANVTDADGLGRVSVNFVDGGVELDLCGGAATACAGSSGNFSLSDIDPSAYGASPGAVVMELWVEDSTGERAIADTHSFTYAPSSPGPGYTLTLIKQGEGDGTITGSVNCPPGCASMSVTIPEGESFTLSAAAAAGSTWIGWAGDACYGPSDCSYPMFSDRTVRASFGLVEQLTATLTAPGDGDSNASPNTQPTIYFNRPVNPGPNVGDIVFREAGGADIPFTPVVANHSPNPRQRLVLVIDGSLQRGSSYEVLVPAGAVEDDDGDLLPLPLAFAFSIAENDFSNMQLAAYPIKIMEGSETTVSVWFTEPVDYDREIVLSATDPGVLKPGDLGTFILPAGEVLLETDVDTELTPGSVSSAFTTLQATEASAGTLSRSLEVANYTSIHGTNLGFLASGVFDDQDGDGVFESGERAELLVEVFNGGPSTSTNVVLDFRVLNTTNLRILGGSPHVCNFGTLQTGQYRSCTKTLLADDELPTGSYFIEIDGRSVSGGFLEQALVNVINNFQPDFQLNVRNITSHPQPPGGIINLVYTGRNEGDGFSLPMPLIEVDIEIEGQTVPLYRTYVDARGDFNNSQTLDLPITVPPNPGAHPIRARINPSGAQQLPEDDFSNNEATELTLYVAGPSQPPELEPLGGPFAVNAGETLSFTAAASDPNGDPLTFTLGAGAPAGAGIDATTGAFTWTPQCSQGLQSYTVEVIVTDSELTSDSESFVVEVSLQGDLEVTQTVNTPLAAPGEVIEYTITVTNHGPSCSNSVAVSDLFPATLGAVTWTCTPTVGSTCSTSGSGDLSDTEVSLQSGASATYVVTATIAEGIEGSVINTASASSFGDAVDPNTNNNSVSSTVSLRDVDYGDAPGNSLGQPWSFPTLLVENGARHGISPGLKLGVSIDGELDGQPTLSADGDDLGAAQDEDGVTLPAELTPCQTAEIEVVVSAPGFLDAWMDFNTDGSWTVPDEQVFTSEPVVAGLNVLTVSVPCSATPAGLAFARFRLSSTGGLAPTGLALDGEVEDHSVLIAQVFHSLGVTKAGTGAGIVIGSPNGIHCGTDCSEDYPVGSLVTLSAQPEVGSGFTGWTGGPCSGTGFCSLTMDAAYSVTATFGVASLPLQVVKDGNGSGQVTSDPLGIDCGSDCSEAFLFNTSVTLTADPDLGSTFVGWSDPACPGESPCTVTVEAATSITATFDLEEYMVQVTSSGVGAGTIVSNPPGIDCGDDCEEALPFGTVVTLTAHPDQQSSFTGWSGDCAGLQACEVSVLGDLAVDAQFELSCLDDIESGPINWATGLGPADTGSSQPWRIVSTDSHSPLRSWFVPDEDFVKDQLLMSAFIVPVSLVDSQPLLQFWHRYDTEPGHDGGVLEYSLDAGLTWIDILEGDGATVPANSARFIQGGYDTVLDVCCSNPLPGRQAWSGMSPGWVNALVDLEDFAGLLVAFRFRMVADDVITETGWWVDDIQLMRFSEGCPISGLFSDGFESGDASGWIRTVP